MDTVKQLKQYLYHFCYAFNSHHSQMRVYIVSVMFTTFQKCSATAGTPWSQTLAEFIRNNDQTLQETSQKLLRTVQEEVMPCESFAEYCDVAGNGQQGVNHRHQVFGRQRVKMIHVCTLHSYRYLG